MTNLLRGVVEHGTGAAAAPLNWPLAGKTGTMDEYTDAWFVGFDPGITIGVWVGHDEKKPLGRNETGAAAAQIQQDILAAGMHGRAFTHLPDLPEWGTMHSKAFLLQYEHGLRVIIFTANAIYCDCNNKTQGLFTQDFPLRQGAAAGASPFQVDLQQYVAALGLPPALAQQARAVIALHDFSAARAHLIASVPAQAGHHGKCNTSCDCLPVSCGAAIFFIWTF